MEGTEVGVNVLTKRRDPKFMARRKKPEKKKKDSEEKQRQSDVSESVASSSSQESATAENSLAEKVEKAFQELVLPVEMAQEAQEMFKGDKVKGFGKRSKLKSRTMVVSRGKGTSIIYRKDDEENRKNVHILGKFKSVESPASFAQPPPTPNPTLPTPTPPTQPYAVPENRRRVKSLEEGNPFSFNRFSKTTRDKKRSLRNALINFRPIEKKTTPALPPKPKSTPVFSREKVIFKVRNSSLPRQEMYFRSSPQLTLEKFLCILSAKFPKVSLLAKEIGGKLSLCLPKHKEYVFHNEEEEEIFHYLTALNNTSYCLPPSKTLGSLRHLISQAVKKNPKLLENFLDLFCSAIGLLGVASSTQRVPPQL